MGSANMDLVRSIYLAWERGDYSSTDLQHPEIEFVVGRSYEFRLPETQYQHCCDPGTDVRSHRELMPAQEAIALAGVCL